jgi:TolB protein
MNPDGSNVRQLTFLGPDNGAFFASWSRDGRQLVFTEFRSNGNPQFWIMKADGSNQHLLLGDLSFFDFAPSFSPDGSQVVFTRCQPGGNCALYSVNVDGTGVTAITNFNPNPDVNDVEAAYSPDGMTIAFNSYWREEFGFMAAIYLVNADGSNIRPLTPPELGAVTPAWSPDGTKIAFHTHDHGAGFVQNEEIWVINADGTDATRLTNNNRHWAGYTTAPHDFAPSWSPQGNAIVFERDDPSYASSAIFVMNADGSGLNQKLMLPRSARKAVELPLSKEGKLGKRTGNRRLRLIENGGAYPRWGPTS